MRAALRSWACRKTSCRCVERPSIPLAQRADGDVRSDDRDRRTGDGQGGVRVRQARLRRRRRQRDDGDRRDRRTSRRRRATRASARPTTTGRAAPADGNLLVDSRDLRRVPRAAAAGRRLPRQRRREGEAAGAPTGTPTGAAPPTRSRAAPTSSRRRPAFALPDGQDVLHRARAPDRQGASLLHREARRGAGDLQVPRLRRWRSTWCGRSSRPAAAATPAASTRSTTTTSTSSRWSRR